MPNGRPIVRVTEIGEFIRHSSCERRFKLGFNNRELARQLPFAERLFNPLDPVLQEVGRQREAEWERSLRDGAGLRDLSRYDERPVDAKAMPWAEFVEALRACTPGQGAYAREVEVSGDIGAFHVQGRVDFIVLQWREGRPGLRLVECKASRRDRTYHRAQVTLYKKLIAGLLQIGEVTAGDARILPEHLECVVARIDESTNEGQAILGLPSLGLEVISSDIDRLLAPGGPLSRILASQLDALPHQLDAKCDGCVFTVHCLPESARARRLELLGVPPSTVRALRGGGIATLDALATLDPQSEAAREIRADAGLSDSVEALVAKAQARRSTLPTGGADPDAYQVEALPGRRQSQLPEHGAHGQRLVRIYLAVDYDYTENRVGALSAHVTTSAGQLYTGFRQVDGRWEPNPEISERVARVGGNEGEYDERPVQGVEIIRFKTSRWTGRIDDDNASERELIQSFLRDLIDAIAQVAGVPQAPIHFYVWSRSEMRQLVEGCTRGGSELLAHLRELLGCRESLEQLIFSCLQEEVDSRYALGWTGRGLTVVTSLRWFGQIYHWRRSIAGQAVNLDQVFTQDLFDFKTDLHLAGDGSWADPPEGGAKHKFEIRSRFSDSLPAPYWHAVWHTLPDPAREDLPHNVRNAIRRYNEAAKPLRLREYLRARVHALRWVDERVRYKNPDIVKPPLDIQQLAQFALGVNSVDQAALDFLRLEQHMRLAQWLASHLTAPANRVPLGQTIPVRDVRAVDGNLLEARISLDGFNVARDELEARCTIAEGSFVRLTPCAEDPQRPQTVGQFFRAGSTCVVDSLDWAAGTVRLSVLSQRSADRYRLMSISRQGGNDVFSHATLDESPSDYVAVRVDGRIVAAAGSHAYRWFDATHPRVPEREPISEERRATIQAALQSIDLGNGNHLMPDQRSAVLDGLSASVQLVQGPPGTGKTEATAVAVLTRIAHSMDRGGIMLVAAGTHTAVDNLLQRISDLQARVRAAFENHGINCPAVAIAKVHSSRPSPADSLPAPIENLAANACAADIQQLRRDAVVVIGGTTSAMLKMANELSGTANFRRGFQENALIVDEASMMVFPHFLALATLVGQESQIMLAGDHRQLAPILTHDWEREDRPPVVAFQPFVSAYDAVRSLSEHPAVTPQAVRRSALVHTFRLPPIVRSLIAQVYRLDNIELQGRGGAPQPVAAGANPWQAMWGGPGLFLVVHDERESRQSNAIEGQIVRRILEAAPVLNQDSVAVITPHRAQRTLLRRLLAPHAREVQIIDTVERLQGGQRPTIIITATASDPTTIAANVDFILNLNRANVAFSRVQERLIVVCADTLLSHMAPELEHYESAFLWKHLRWLCTHEIAAVEVDGYHAAVLTADLQRAGIVSPNGGANG